MFVNFYTFRKHVSDHHSDDPNPTNRQDQDVSTPELHDSSITADDIQDVVEDSAEPHAALSTLQTSSALFLIGLVCTHAYRCV